MIDPLLITARLPAPLELERRMAALAMIELILDWRYDTCDYVFSRDLESGRRHAMMWNGCGDTYRIVMLSDGQAALVGNAHEYRGPSDEYFRRLGVFDGIPPVFSDFISPPTNGAMDPVSFAMWFTKGRWERSVSLDADAIAKDGSGYFLHKLIESADEYTASLAADREVDVEVEVVERFFDHEPLTIELARRLCDDVSFAQIAEWFALIPYPRRDESNHAQLELPFAKRAAP